MSWSLSFSADSKDDALKRVQSERDSNQYFPAAIADSVAAAIGAVPDGLGVSVSSSGHLSDYLTSSLSVYSLHVKKEPT